MRPKQTASQRGEDLQELIDELQLPECTMNWLFFNEIKASECKGTEDAMEKLERMKAEILKDHDLEKFVFNHKSGNLEDCLIKFADGKFYSKYIHSENDNSEQYYNATEGFEVFTNEEACFAVMDAADAKSYIKEWKEITEQDYWEALEVLPPIFWRSGGGAESFFISEAMTSNIHSCCIKINDKFYTAMRRTTLSHDELLKDLLRQLLALKIKDQSED